ncbi:hypothetical protein GOP47_0012553 [Adiantum capillus-veneris]|uniref:GOLD domain-containing protein n=1 Tax=Adiantum capillus-veneris TaxID=13818 RepID=A0A9D4US01_ADICA|nr:hypothetical protein GOP47_0012553 [Adiantum capillus-veneris]
MAMKVGVLLLVAFAFLIGPAKAVRFVLTQEECFSEEVEYDGDLMHVSFVVIRADSAWNFHHPISGVDLTIEGPNNFRQEVYDKSADKLEFLASHRGSYKICLKNKSPYSEMVDFSVHVGHIPYYDQKLQDDHINPLMGQIAKLEEAIYAVQFEQHWLYAQTEQQSVLNDNLSRRLVYRALFEAAALIGASVLQVYLLRRLFNKKLNQSRV